MATADNTTHVTSQPQAQPQPPNMSTAPADSKDSKEIKDSKLSGKPDEKHAPVSDDVSAERSAVYDNPKFVAIRTELKKFGASVSVCVCVCVCDV